MAVPATQSSDQVSKKVCCHLVAHQSNVPPRFWLAMGPLVYMWKVSVLSSVPNQERPIPSYRNVQGGVVPQHSKSNPELPTRYFVLDYFSLNTCIQVFAGLHFQFTQVTLFESNSRVVILACSPLGGRAPSTFKYGNYAPSPPGGNVSHILK